MKRFYLVFIFIIAMAPAIRAQTCWESVETAQQLFVSGDYESCVKLVKEALATCDFTSAETEDAMVLHAKANIELDNLEETDKSIKALLKNNPNFKTKAGVQSEDFYKHVKQFNVTPLVAIGLKASGVLPFFNTTKVVSILDSVDYGAPYTSNGFGYSLGGKLEIEPVKNWSLNVDVMSTVVEYKRLLQKPTDWQLTYSEKLTYFEMPFYLKKSISLYEKYFPYITVGGSWLQLSRSFGNIDIRYDATDPLTKLKEDFKQIQTEINQKELRNANIYEWLIGMGISYKKNNFRYSMDAKYYGGLTNIMNANRRYGNAELIYLYNYIDNNVLLNKMEFGCSVSYILMYTVKKMRDAKY